MADKKEKRTTGEDKNLIEENSQSSAVAGLDSRKQVATSSRKGLDWEGTNVIVSR